MSAIIEANKHKALLDGVFAEQNHDEIAQELRDLTESEVSDLNRSLSGEPVAHKPRSLTESETRELDRALSGEPVTRPTPAGLTEKQRAAQVRMIQEVIGSDSSNLK